ncbi:MAG: 4Fe-4S dicluster domain-containing protein [Pseudomonadota bacterium]
MKEIQTVLYEEVMDHAFVQEVHSIPGGDEIKRCIQCGTCSGTCPVSWAMEESPRQIIAMIRAGLRDKVLSSTTIWTCASCYSCTARCPQEIKITDIMYILKRLAMRQEMAHGKPAQALSTSFIRLVNRYGRNHELGLMMRFMLKTHPFGSIKNAGVGLRLLSRGRLPLRRSRIKDSEGLRKIIAKAQTLGGEL